MFDPPSGPQRPLPGTTPSPRAFFVDRWGTLLQTPPHGHAKSVDELAFTEGAVDALYRASQAGWRIYLLGNEEAVYRGELSVDVWNEIQDALLSHLTGHGVKIHRCYACLEHPEGVNGQSGDSVYLLPNTGAFYHAAHNDAVQLEKSWVVGDSTLELVAGWRSGCRMAGVQTGQALKDGTFPVEPEMVGENLCEVILSLLSYDTALHP